MAAKGIPDFDAVAVLEVEEIDWRAGAPALVAHAAFVNSENGKTYGSTSLRAGWSKKTLELLDSLRSSMEQDIADVVMKKGTTDTISEPTRKQDREPGGIAEDLAQDAPQF